MRRGRGEPAYLPAHPPTGGGGIIEADGLERSGGRGSGERLENGAFYSSPFSYPRSHTCLLLPLSFLRLVSFGVSFLFSSFVPPVVSVPCRFCPSVPFLILFLVVSLLVPPCVPPVRLAPSRLASSSCSYLLSPVRSCSCPFPMSPHGKTS